MTLTERLAELGFKQVGRGMVVADPELARMHIVDLHIMAAEYEAMPAKNNSTHERDLASARACRRDAARFTKQICALQAQQVR